jgi:hypothetical protein
MWRVETSDSMANCCWLIRRAVRHSRKREPNPIGVAVMDDMQRL